MRMMLRAFEGLKEGLVEGGGGEIVPKAVNGIGGTLIYVSVHGYKLAIISQTSDLENVSKFFVLD